MSGFLKSSFSPHTPGFGLPPELWRQSLSFPFWQPKQAEVQFSLQVFNPQKFSASDLISLLILLGHRKGKRKGNIYSGN